MLFLILFGIIFIFSGLNINTMQISKIIHFLLFTGLAIGYIVCTFYSACSDFSKNNFNKIKNTIQEHPIKITCTKAYERSFPLDLYIYNDFIAIYKFLGISLPDTEFSIQVKKDYELILSLMNNNLK